MVFLSLVIFIFMLLYTRAGGYSQVSIRLWWKFRIFFSLSCIEVTLCLQYSERWFKSTHRRGRMHITWSVLLTLVLLTGVVRTEDEIPTEISAMWPVIPVFQKLATSTKNHCSNHSLQLLQALKNASVWAVQSK